MKCLFLFCDAPLSPNYSGIASRHFESFLALCRLGIQVHVWRMLSVEEQGRILNFEEDELEWKNKTRHLAASWSDIPYSRFSTFGRLETFTKFLFNSIELSFAPYLSLKNKFQETLQIVQPDFIWAEHTQSAALVSISSQLPWIYAHYDWWFKIAKVRRKLGSRYYYLSQRAYDWAFKQTEIKLARKATAVITGSKTEAEELARLGARHVQIIPTTYPPVEIKLEQEPSIKKIKIVHLGSLNTTANYQGLMVYLDRIHPKIVQALGDRLELIVIGETRITKPDLMERLRKQSAILLGHIRDLSSVLVPYDIAIIPYEMDSGTRTKLGMLFNYAQVVVTTQSAVAGSEEVLHGENCLVFSSLDEFPSAIIALANNSTERIRLGRSARETFNRNFTLESQIGNFREVLTCLKESTVT